MIWAMLAAQLADLATYTMAVRLYPHGESGILSMLGLSDLVIPKLLGVLLMVLIVLRLPPRLKTAGMAAAALVGILGAFSGLSVYLI
jgi:hypothetical protein